MIGLCLPGAAQATAPSAVHPVAAAAAAATDSFSTSFEQGQPQPAISTVETGADGQPRQHNVTGKSTASGSLLDSVTGVTASAENAPGEVAANLADANPDTKWLAFASTGWVRYQLSSPAKAVSYSLTSASDAAERDPKNFTLQGSTDGSTWTDLDTRTGIDFADRSTTRTFQVSAPAQVSYYRLNITAVHSGSIVQLADWDLSDGSTGGGAPTPMVTSVGSGPISGLNIKPLTGWTGIKAMRYSGGHTATGRGYAWNQLFGTNLTVDADTQLQYKIFPDMIAGDLTYPSTFAAIDLHFTDGTYLSDLKPVDSHGISASPSGQGAGKILYASQWNAVNIDVGAVAAGKTVDRILVGYDNATNASATTRFGGWIDDLKVADKAAPVDGSDLTNYVDVRRGTNASGSFSRGNNLPISALPNGFTFLTPVTDANSQSWQYYYQAQNNAQNLPVLQGLAVSHEPSPWMGDRNQMSVMPSIGGGVPTGSADDRGLTFDHNTETAHPDYYRVQLAGGLIAETTPADHGGELRFTFPDSAATGHLVVDTIDNNGAFTIDAATGSFSGWVDNGSGLSAGRSRMFVYGTFDAPVTGSGTAPNGHTGTRYVTFDTASDKQVTLKLATSFISLDQAKHNHALELADNDFDAVRATANAKWNARLGVLAVEGANESERLATYSNLYRLNLYPNSQFENTGTAAAPHYQYASPVSAKSGDATTTKTNAKLVDGKIYVNNGFWDTYRTVWPAYTLLYPEVAAEIADGFVQQYRDGGWIARWSSPGYADLMTGTSSDVALADAYLKGVALPDPLSTYDAALKNATTLSGRSAVGRKGLSTSIFKGYTANSTGESVSWGLEGLINDYGIGNMAAKLAKDPSVPADRRAELAEESEYFLKRSTDYVNLFDPSSEFFRGRNDDGTFPADFDPLDWGGDFTETNGWNFAFHAPQDGNGLANLYGGRKALADKLDEFFATPETATHPGGYGGVIHEMVEARDVRMGMLGMSNQVSHHIPYMYDYTGEQYKTAAKVREILQRLYVGSEIGQGYPGDEDNGEMSSWYLLSTLGIYPLQVGSADWVVGSPQFSKVTVHRTQGDLVINAAGNSHSNVYVQSLKVNGKKHTSVSIDQADLAGSATLDFTMGNQPSAFGSKPADAPASLTTGSAKPLPLQDATGEGMGVPSTDDAGAGGQHTDVSALFDDNSTTAVTFAGATPTVTYQLTGLGQRATWYTLTSGPNAGDPASWKVEGSQDGKQWRTLDTRTDESFAWRTQTRPFKMGRTGQYSRYRLVVTGTAGASLPNLSEVEFLTDGRFGTKGKLSVVGRTDLETVEGQQFSGTIATLSGGRGTVPADFTVSIDWGDGSSSAGQVIAGRLGTFTVKATHTFSSAGYFRPIVTVRDASGLSNSAAGITVHFALVPSYASGFNLTCIGDVGTEVACDGRNAGINRAALIAAGGAPGRALSVPGTDLTYTLPSIPNGEPDNATGDGQTLPVTLAPGATAMSLIGTATQKNQDTVGVVTFTDGSSVNYPIQYGDWCGSAQFGNIVALQMSNRLYGTGTDGCQSKLFATAPMVVPAGKTVQAITLARQTGDPIVNGRIHVFAVADNGSALQLTPGPDPTIRPMVDQSVLLGTISGGVPGADGYVARVQWGDATATESATVSAVNADGVATITGTHNYRAVGNYTVHIVAADENSDAVAALHVVVGDGAPSAPSAASSVDASRPGHSLTVRGNGFTPGESVTVALGSGPVSRQQIAAGKGKAAASRTVKADSNGNVTATVAVPADADEGLYGVTLRGSSSKTVATDTVTVAEPETAITYHPQALVSADTGHRGQLLRTDANSFAPNEWVTVTFDRTVIGRVAANNDGVITDLRVTVPDDAKAGEHRITFTGGSSAASTERHYLVLADPKPGSPEVPGPSTAVPPTGGAGR